MRTFLHPLAAMLAAAIGIPIEFIAADRRGVQHMRLASVQSPVEGVLSLLAGATGWDNLLPLRAASLPAKIVLIDFWTYGCIKLMRSLPSVCGWAEMYRKVGSVVAGVHTPAFASEREADKARRAAQELRHDYPIAVDTDYAIWRAFTHEYWPVLYPVGSRGRIRCLHFGEARTKQLEAMIQE